MWLKPVRADLQPKADSSSILTSSVAIFGDKNYKEPWKLQTQNGYFHGKLEGLEKAESKEQNK